MVWFLEFEIELANNLRGREGFFPLNYCFAGGYGLSNFQTHSVALSSNIFILSPSEVVSPDVTGMETTK